MDFYLHIFWPQETLLRIVIFALWIAAMFVVFKCALLYKRIAANLQKVDELGSTEEGFVQPIAHLENSLKMNNISYTATFSKFEEDSGKNAANEPIFEHIKAIYDAGRKSSRLDADLLVKNTIDKICTDVDTIKSCISVFLVIGILGTLIGLGLSIGSFNSDNFIINAQANNATKELSKLFGNLRGAFAPSMWGVFLTILFVIFYTVIIQERCINKLTDRLTTNTIKVWLPALYPTDFQKGENTMVQLKETINSADKINQGVNELESNLSNANSTINALCEVSEALNESVANFNEGSNKVLELKNSITELSAQITSTNQSYQEWLNNAVAQVSRFQTESRESLRQQSAAVQEHFDSQNAQLTSVVKSLKLYDEHAFGVQDSLNNKLTESIQSSKQAVNDMQGATEQLEKRNAEVVAVISDKLSKDLQAISEQLKHINNPLEQASVEIQKMFCNMNKSNVDTMEAVLKKNGVSQEERRQLLASSRDDEDSKALGKKLDAILKCLQQGAGGGSSQSVQDDSILGMIKSFMPVAVGVLLAISIIVQCVMVSRIGDLEQSQNAVNQVLLKGDKADK